MVSIFASVIIVITLAMIVQLIGASTAAEGVLLGLLAGVGFVAATQLPNYMFEPRSLKIYVINVGYPAVTFTTIGLLLTVWQQVRDPHQRAVARRGWVCSALSLYFCPTPSTPRPLPKNPISRCSWVGTSTTGRSSSSRRSYDSWATSRLSDGLSRWCI